MRFCAIVAAGGSGERFGQPKQLIDVTGRPMVAWSFAAFEELAELDHMVIATEPAHLDRMESLARTFAPHLRTRVVASGPTRQGSVRNALAAVPDECDGVLVHDGARPLVRARDIRAGMAVVGLHPAGRRRRLVPGAPCRRDRARHDARSP